MRRSLFLYYDQVFFLVSQRHHGAGTTYNTVFLVGEHRTKTCITQELCFGIIGGKDIRANHIAADGLVPAESAFLVGSKLLGTAEIEPCQCACRRGNAVIAVDIYKRGIDILSAAVDHHRVFGNGYAGTDGGYLPVAYY